MYNYANRDWVVVNYPRIDLSRNGNIEGFGMVEFKPKINENLSLYTRSQGLYTVTLKANELLPNRHQRSYVIARAGLVYKEEGGKVRG